MKKAISVSILIPFLLLACLDSEEADYARLEKCDFEDSVATGTACDSGTICVIRRTRPNPVWTCIGDSGDIEVSVELAGRYQIVLNDTRLSAGSPMIFHFPISGLRPRNSLRVQQDSGLRYHFLFLRP